MCDLFYKFVTLLNFEVGREMSWRIMERYVMSEPILCKLENEKKGLNSIKRDNKCY